MIVSLNKPASCQRSVAYILGKRDARLLATTMAGSRIDEFVHELEAVAGANRRVKLPYFHASLRPAPGESLTDEQWREVSSRFLAGMGFDDNASLTVLHADASEHHIHVFACRVRYSGGVVSDSWDYLRAMDLAREIERDYGLRVVPHPTDRKEVPGPADEEDSVLRQLRASIEKAAEGGPSVTEFIDRLRAAGVDVRPNVAHSGRVSGLAYAYGGLTVKGSTLGRAFSWSGIQAQLGVHYAPELDLPALTRGALALAPRSPADEPAAPLPPPAAAPQPSRPQALPAARSVLGETVSAHLDALGADRFKVLVVQPDAERPMVRLWRRDQVLASIDWLAHQNRQGAEILVRNEPSWEVVHLDNLSRARLERARAAGYEPAAVVATGRDRYEAWLRHPAPVTARESSLLRQTLAAHLEATADRDGYGHLAGFETHLGDASRPVLLEAAPGRVYTHASHLVARVRLELEQRAAARAARAEIERFSREPASVEKLKGLEDLHNQARPHEPLEPRALTVTEAWGRYEAGRREPQLSRSGEDPAAEQLTIDRTRTFYAARARLEHLTLMAPLPDNVTLDDVTKAAALAQRLHAAEDRAAMPNSGTRRDLASGRDRSAELAVEHLRGRLAEAHAEAGYVPARPLLAFPVGLDERYQAAASHARRAPEWRGPRLEAELELERFAAELRQYLQALSLERSRLLGRLERLESVLPNHTRPDVVSTVHERLLSESKAIEAKIDQLVPIVRRLDREALTRDLERLASQLQMAPTRELVERHFQLLVRRHELADRPAIGTPGTPTGRTPDLASHVERSRQALLAAPSRERVTALEQASLELIASTAPPESEVLVRLRAARAGLSRATREALRAPAPPTIQSLNGALSRHHAAESALGQVLERRSPPGPSAGSERLRTLLVRLERGDRSPELVRHLQHELRHHVPAISLAPPAPRPPAPFIEAVASSRQDLAEFLRASRAVSRTELPEPGQLDRLARALLRSSRSAADVYDQHLVARGLTPLRPYLRDQGALIHHGAAVWSRTALRTARPADVRESLTRGNPGLSFGAASLLTGFVLKHLAAQAKRELRDQLRGREHEHDR